MNNDRRKSITKLIATAEALKALAEELSGKLDDLASEIETIKSEEEEYRDNMAENLQGSERYYDSEAASEQLDQAFNAAEEMREAIDADKLDEIVTALDEAKV